MLNITAQYLNIDVAICLNNEKIGYHIAGTNYVIPVNFSKNIFDKNNLNFKNEDDLLKINVKIREQNGWIKIKKGFDLSEYKSVPMDVDIEDKKYLILNEKQQHDCIYYLKDEADNYIAYLFMALRFDNPIPSSDNVNLDFKNYLQKADWREIVDKNTNEILGYLDKGSFHIIDGIRGYYKETWNNRLDWRQRATLFISKDDVDILKSMKANDIDYLNLYEEIKSFTEYDNYYRIYVQMRNARVTTDGNLDCGYYVTEDSTSYSNIGKFDELIISRGGKKLNRISSVMNIQKIKNQTLLSLKKEPIIISDDIAKIKLEKYHFDDSIQNRVALECMVLKNTILKNSMFKTVQGITFKNTSIVSFGLEKLANKICEQREKVDKHKLYKKGFFKKLSSLI